MCSRRSRKPNAKALRAFVFWVVMVVSPKAWRRWICWCQATKPRGFKKDTSCSCTSFARSWKKSCRVNEEGRMQNEEKDLAARTKDFARRIIRLYSALPKETVAQVLGKQVLRSGTSVGANYREANRARSKAEFVSKIGDCLKKADETAYWLELMADEGIVSRKRLGPLLQETNELIAILVTISKRARGD